MIVRWRTESIPNGGHSSTRDLPFSKGLTDTEKKSFLSFMIEIAPGIVTWMEISFDVLEFGDARALDQLVSVFAKEFSKDPHEFVEKMGLERTALVEQLQWNDVPLPGVMNLYSG